MGNGRANKEKERRRVMRKEGRSRRGGRRKNEGGRREDIVMRNVNICNFSINFLPVSMKLR